MTRLQLQCMFPAALRCHCQDYGVSFISKKLDSRLCTRVNSDINNFYYPDFCIFANRIIPDNRQILLSRDLRDELIVKSWYNFVVNIDTCD